MPLVQLVEILVGGQRKIGLVFTLSMRILDAYPDYVYTLVILEVTNMQRVYNRKAPKQAANLSINSDLLKAARDAGVNLSSVLEEALAQRVASVKRDAWRRDNADAIDAYNHFTDEHGVYSDGSRSF